MLYTLSGLQEGKENIGMDIYRATISVMIRGGKGCSMAMSCGKEMSLSTGMQFPLLPFHLPNLHAFPRPFPRPPYAYSKTPP